MTLPLEDRILRERQHASVVLAAHESNWGWHTPAGKIRRQRRADFLCQAPAGLKPGARVLEIGCGTGTFTGALAAAYGSVTALDVSDQMLAEARKKVPGATFVEADIHHTTLPAASFDVVLGCSVLHHLDWDVALREIHRLLKPGGELRFSEPNMLNPQIFLQKTVPWLKARAGDSPDETAFTSTTIRRSLQRAGFVDVVAQPFEFLHPSIPEALMETVMRLEHVLEGTALRAIGGSIKISARKP